MAGMTSTGSVPADAADHSAMPGVQPTGRMPRGSSPPMDHSTMPGMPSAGNQSAMDHGAMTGMGGLEADTAAGADLATTEKLRRLAALLVGDSAVQERIQADSALRSGWQDEDVRDVLAPR